jgi:uncharacterized protein YmfQ (DUF2313 family)
MSGPPAWSDADIAGAFAQHFPVGRAWPRDPNSVFMQTVAALTPTFQRLVARGSNLLIDAFPATTVELLPEWQATLGLPDPCAGPSPVLAVEQAQVLARFEAGGGQSIAFFVNFALTLGYAITIDQFTPFTAGHGTAGSPVYGLAWAYAWQVNAPAIDIEYFLAGSGTAGQALQTVLSSTVLECELLRLAPAHTVVFFVF